MTHIRLYGYLTDVDNYNRLQFLYSGGKYDSYEKIHNLFKNIFKDIAEYNLPYNTTGFWIKCEDPSLYKESIGNRFQIDVKIIRYSFLSRLEKNYGQRINGFKFKVIDIIQL